MTARPRPPAHRPAALALGLLLALTGCTGQAPGAVQGRSAAPDPAAPSPTAASPTAPASTPTGTPAGTPAPRTPPPTAPAPDAPDGTTPAPPQPSPTAAAFPPASSAVEQGSRVWAVYLAVSRLGADGRAEDPAELDGAREQAEAVGYEGQVGGGDADCDQGAREALRLDPDRKYLTASLFFDTQAQARQFVDAYEPPVVGTARITAFCLD